MSRKKVYIEDLTDTEISTLHEGWKNGKSHDFRNRCQCILMSHQGYDADALSQLFPVTKTTIYEWLKNWKKEGITGLIRTPGQGRKPNLSITNETHVKIVETAVRNAAETGTNMRDEILENLGLEDGFSQRTLRRFLQKKTSLTRGFADSLKKTPMKKN